ncbi:MAG TPA: GspH/FimT family pseudopilin [Burkholderiales bacterium]|nr:GspH/FimT family pseudopilin [Burkholderiales bacterium]
MLRHPRQRQRGVSLVELMLGLAILAILLFMGVPAFTDTLQNYQIRTAAESTVNGLQFARNEALRRNMSVRFQLVNSLDANCDLSPTGPSWIVSRNDPTAACDSATVIDFLEPNDLSQPQVLQSRASQEGTPNAVFSATASGAGATTVTFTSLGRVAPGSIDTINISNAVGGACQHLDASGRMRCLRILVGRGGQVKMCDPGVTDTADPRACL